MAVSGGVGTSGVVVAVSQWRCWDERCCSGCESEEVLGRAVL